MAEWLERDVSTFATIDLRKNAQAAGDATTAVRPASGVAGKSGVAGRIAFTAGGGFSIGQS